MVFASTLLLAAQYRLDDLAYLFIPVRSWFRNKMKNSKLIYFLSYRLFFKIKAGKEQKTQSAVKSITV